jgi:hypothetical protein
MSIIELDWRARTYVRNVGCHIAAVDDGFLIASIESPRFCFHAETQEAAIMKAARAIDLMRRALAQRDEGKTETEK